MASLLYYPRYQVIYNGAALAGGKVWTYAAGTTTPKNSYTDSGAGSTNTNPVILDSQGTASIWLVGAYKIVTQTAAGVTIDTTDNVVDFGSILSGASTGATLASPTITGTANFTGSSVTWGGNPTHSGNHTFSQDVTIKGNTTIGDAGADALTINPAAVTWNSVGTTHANDHTYSGKVYKTNQPGFSAYTTAAFNIGQSSVVVDVIYGTEDYDNGNCYNNTTGVFTAPVAGRYLINFGITPQFAAGSAAGTVIIAAMLKNGASMSGRAALTCMKTLAGALSEIGPNLTFSAIIKLAASDTLKWQATYTDAVSLTCSAFSCGFSAELLG